MTPEAARAAIDAARAHVARARADWDRIHRIDGGIGTSAAGVARDRLAVAERDLRGLEAIAALARLAGGRP